MTNPTSNFGWQMPTSTDLVTDLPADFEVFGQAVDTDFVDLLGGANGYILSKASATDLDFAWIPNDQGDITAVNVTSPITGGGSAGAVTIGINAATTSVVGAVQLSDSTSTTSSVLASTPTATKAAYDLAAAAVPKSTVTTAGDVIYATGSAAVTRLGIGTANQVLAVNSGATAPEWKTINLSSGLTFISRTTFSASAQVNVDSVFTTTYSAYMVVIEEMQAGTSTDDAQMLMRRGSTSSTTGIYGASVGSTYNGTPANFGTTNGAQMNLCSNTGGFASTLFFNNVGTGSSKVARVNGTYMDSDNGGGGSIGFVCADAQNWNGFALKSSSSTITGAVTVYGLAKA
jgi:hypothetical protein